MKLQIFLYALWGFLWAGYFALDGLDFGVGMLFAILGRGSAERRLMLNSIGPVWNGNEVWLLGAGAITFAAFPAAYASIFSSFYLLFVILAGGLILRGVVFEFRGSLESAGWTGIWDAAFILGSVVPAFLFGIIFGNIFRGLAMGSSGFRGSFLSFFNPYSLLTGVLFLALFSYHGAVWLAARTGGGMQRKAESAAAAGWFVLLAVCAAFAVYTGYDTRLFDNFVNHPAWWLVPLLLVASLAASGWFVLRRRALAAFLASGLAIALTVFFGIVGLYPDLLPSSTDSRYSVTLANAAASDYALWLMAGLLVIFLPLIIGYQLWVYGLFRGRLLEEEVAQDKDAY